MVKRKSESLDISTEEKKVKVSHEGNSGSGVVYERNAHSSLDDAPQPDSEEKSTPTTILDLPREILLEIVYLLALQKNQGAEHSPNRHVVFKTRNTLRGVCKTWCAYIDGDSALWADIHINGLRIPVDYGEKPKQDAYDHAEVAIAELSILRSRNRDINLTLLEPTYTVCFRSHDPIPYKAREGVLEVINIALKERRITSLSIVARDFGFVRQLLDPSSVGGNCTAEIS
ncbi:hypothetical protein DFP72DRAFT_1058248 [Ephemerocybe angulata]|uniref:F-box domain-containing protein n=1 Tax=Ephemerocybe angulata TaxID=980116 RepID=A0A8H6IHE8_9AGAR|nr:hypothetical protein DFP72DRAFT_1058248 [Tulosesus angulatus]